jgi:hypothetical protein
MVTITTDAESTQHPAISGSARVLASTQSSGYFDASAQSFEQHGRKLLRHPGSMTAAHRRTSSYSQRSEIAMKLRTSATRARSLVCVVLSRGHDAHPGHRTDRACGTRSPIPGSWTWPPSPRRPLTGTRFGAAMSRYRATGSAYAAQRTAVQRARTSTRRTGLQVRPQVSRCRPSLAFF